MNEEALSEIAADLVSNKKNQLFVERLLAEAPGRWHDIHALSRGLTDTETRLRSLSGELTGPPRVTWLEYPDSAYGAGYCVILFFHEDLHWSKVAIYNTNIISKP